MSINHNIFIPLPVRNNYPNANDPEIKFIDISIIRSNGAKVEVKRGNIMGKQYTKLVIEWAYFIKTKETDKELLYFGGRDNFDVTEPIPDAFDYITLISGSHNRFTGHFDKYGLIDKLLPLSLTSIDQVRSQIIAALNTPK